MINPISNRYDFVLLFDVKDGNPNGDPDAGNMPRVDPETGHGLVTDVALKRKVRNYVEIKYEDKSPNRIYVREGTILKKQCEPAFAGGASLEKAVSFMCAHFYDVRSFGAVMPQKGKDSGQVRGPVQLTFARSENRVLPQDHTISRVAREKENGPVGITGSKFTVAYGLYRAHGFVSPHLADGDKGTGFSEGDLALFWEALEKMFDFDRSAARGLMATRRLIAFKHESKLGNARSQDLFERVAVNAKSDTPRGYGDFEVTVNKADLPSGISVLHLV